MKLYRKILFYMMFYVCHVLFWDFRPLTSPPLSQVMVPLPRARPCVGGFRLQQPGVGMATDANE